MDVWVESWRPKVLGDIVGQPLIINKLKQLISTGNITNLLFHGLPGNGKTSSAIALARHIYGEFNLKGNFKEVNYHPLK